MKLLINIILVLIVLAGFGGMIYLSVNGNRFLGAAGLAMLCFILSGQLVISLTAIRLKNVAEFNRRDPKDLFYFHFLYYT